MQIRAITYEDFNGEMQTENFAFHLSKTDIVTLQVAEGGFQEFIEKLVASQDNEGLLREFKKILLMSYGVKSENGKRFIKNDELREEFEQSAAFDALFMELIQDEGALAKFFADVVPRDIGAVIEEGMAETTQDVTQLPPAPGVS